MRKILLASTLTISLWAAQNNVYSITFNSPIEKVEKNMLAKFQAENLIVAWQLDILEEFEKRGLVKKLGENYNKAKLSNVKTMIACNGIIGNEIINTDPAMMAYCPIRITLTEKEGKTTVLYVRPTSAPKDSKAYPTLQKLEAKVTKAIEDSMEME